MMPLVSSAELCARVAASVVLPQTDEDKTDEARVESALQSATGVIAAHLLWLLDKNCPACHAAVRGRVSILPLTA
jgi:hypothetical protein